MKPEYKIAIFTESFLFYAYNMLMVYHLTRHSNSTITKKAVVMVSSVPLPQNGVRLTEEEVQNGIICCLQVNHLKHAIATVINGFISCGHTPISCLATYFYLYHGKP